MKFVRITKSRHRDTAFSGEGARLYGGRWNDKGHPAVYLADSIALAQLEILVHLKSEDSLKDYVLLEVDVPDTLIAYLDDEDYPQDWNDLEPQASTKDIGTAFLEQQSAVALVIRSSVVPQQFNALFNPEHPEAKAVSAAARAIPMDFDPRLVPRNND